uniref:Uncharacterized protein n=1 Tax=Ditylenchus dipsaci TaxID=166011 RepID=A0A915CP91_9BILA
MVIYISVMYLKSADVNSCLKCIFTAVDQGLILEEPENPATRPRRVSFAAPADPIPNVSSTGPPRSILRSRTASSSSPANQFPSFTPRRSDRLQKPRRFLVWIRRRKATNSKKMLSGTAREMSKIDPKLYVYHDCNDGWKPCQRRFSIMIPDKYVTMATHLDSSTMLEQLSWLASSQERHETAFIDLLKLTNQDRYILSICQ